MKYPESIEKLIKCFEMYPGVGPKSAERMALFTISKLSEENVMRFSQSLIDVTTVIKECDNCGNITDHDLCDICLDESRENTIMVVESSRDVISFEKTNIYRGRYHVLNGTISPINGVGPEDININSLFTRISKEETKEIILSLSSTISGEMTSLYIAKMLENSGVEVNRIGYGLPAGADIGYLDEITLTKALEGKKKI
ncbi:MAG: recombination mediator RecR [Bacilli bacterium]